MKYLLYKLIFFIVLINILSGCKKYENGPMISFITKKERIVNYWQIEKVIFEGQDVTSSVISSTLDYRFDIRNDNSFIISEEKPNQGGNNTNPKERDIINYGTWNFINNNEKILLTNTKNQSTIYQIIKLKNKQLWLKEQNSSFSYEIHFKP